MTSSPVPTTDLYKTLGLTYPASEYDIKRAYKKLALEHHPDRHPPANKQTQESIFHEISVAYSHLSSPSKKEAYDSTHFPAPPKPEPKPSSFIPKQTPPTRKPDDTPTYTPLHLSLQTLFHSYPKKVSVTRTRLSNMGVPVLSQADLTIPTNPQIVDGEQFRVPNEGNQIRKGVFEDLYFVWRVKPNPVFRRREGSAELGLTLVVSSSMAQQRSGRGFIVEGIDGRKLDVGAVLRKQAVEVRDGGVVRIPGAGWWKGRKSEGARGDLVVQFKIGEEESTNGRKDEEHKTVPVKRKAGRPPKKKVDPDTPIPVAAEPISNMIPTKRKPGRPPRAKPDIPTPKTDAVLPSDPPPPSTPSSVGPPLKRKPGRPPRQKPDTPLSTPLTPLNEFKTPRRTSSRFSRYRADENDVITPPLSTPKPMSPSTGPDIGHDELSDQVSQQQNPHPHVPPFIPAEKIPPHQKPPSDSQDDPHTGPASKVDSPQHFIEAKSVSKEMPTALEDKVGDVVPAKTVLDSEWMEQNTSTKVDMPSAEILPDMEVDRINPQNSCLDVHGTGGPASNTEERSTEVQDDAGLNFAMPGPASTFEECSAELQYDAGRHFATPGPASTIEERSELQDDGGLCFATPGPASAPEEFLTASEGEEADDDVSFGERKLGGEGDTPAVFGSEEDGDDVVFAKRRLSGKGGEWVRVDVVVDSEDVVMREEADGVLFVERMLGLAENARGFVCEVDDILDISVGAWSPSGGMGNRKREEDKENAEHSDLDAMQTETHCPSTTAPCAEPVNPLKRKPAPKFLDLSTILPPTQQRATKHHTTYHAFYINSDSELSEGNKSGRKEKKKRRKVKRKMSNVDYEAKEGADWVI
ncbi:hypothetical protein HDV05_004138 [Chytridiales sp. JEL 0842]|nr:hypothetical protein HDV05_004138 [Chytridiales sp. JEL 0842]